jgi:hypothetical protein
MVQNTGVDKVNTAQTTNCNLTVVAVAILK